MGSGFLGKLPAQGGLAALLGLVVLGATPALAKQCVWNKAGFVLRVDWFKPGGFTVAQNPSDGFNEYSFLQQPTQSNVLLAPSGRCIDRGPDAYVAVLSMCGTDPSFNLSRVVLYPADWPQDNRLTDCSIFLSIQPSTTRYLDVWGWMFEPKTGEGGPI